MLYRYTLHMIVITDDVLFLPAIFSQFSPRVPFHESLETSRWADSLRLRLCPIGGQHLLHGFRDLVIRSSCKLDCSPCAICHEFIRMRVSSDWEQIVATATVLNRGPASVARLYEVGANSTVHRAHELTFDQFTVRILRLVHFLFSFILEQLQNTGPYFQVLNRSGSVAR